MNNTLNDTSDAALSQMLSIDVDSNAQVPQKETKMTPDTSKLYKIVGNGTQNALGHFIGSRTFRKGSARSRIFEALSEGPLTVHEMHVLTGASIRNIRSAIQAWDHVVEA